MTGRTFARALLLAWLVTVPACMWSITQHSDIPLWPALLSGAAAGFASGYGIVCLAGLVHFAIWGKDE